MVRDFIFASAVGVGLSVLAACQPSVPNSGAVVTFENTVEAQRQRDAQLANQPVINAPPPVTNGTLPPVGAAPASQPLPASVTAAVNNDPTQVAANSGVAPVQASPSNPAPELVNNPGISSEQDFDTVSAQRSIESDAQRIARNRAQYTLVNATDLPTRPGSDQPNIVQFALKTNNPVGAQIYRRNGFRSAQRHAAACSQFASADQAQIQFLSKGGPARDRGGLDPDGDGYACTWDPSPFRSARASVAAPETENGVIPAGTPVTEPLAISTE